VKQIVELDRSAPSHLPYLDLQTSLRLGHTQSCQGKAPGSHLLPALVMFGEDKLQHIEFAIPETKDE
jgi:hypothetical protein